MRTIERASVFKRDYKRIKATPRHRSNFDALFLSVITLLANDLLIPSKTPIMSFQEEAAMSLMADNFNGSIA